MMIAHFATPQWSVDHHVQVGPRGRVHLELPREWRINYNGKQRTKGGTVADQAGRPRMEITLFTGAGANPNVRKWSVHHDDLSLPFGTVEVRRRTETNGSPFPSHPQYVPEHTPVVHYEFYVGNDLLRFTLLPEEEATLTPIIWSIMETAKCE